MVPTWFDILGIYGTFWMYSAIAIVVALLSYLYMPETVGMSLEEIEQMYRPVENKKSRIDLASDLGLTSRARRDIIYETFSRET